MPKSTITIFHGLHFIMLAMKVIHVVVINILLNLYFSYWDDWMRQDEQRKGRFVNNNMYLCHCVCACTCVSTCTRVSTAITDSTEVSPTTNTLVILHSFLGCIEV